ncbi:hypothetical protein NK718_00840 [Alsobacter sp. SYSU M60028]|uniref:DUF333 domain-containing protein n=1 Tax=Alsobacter ponti TaxID=2962936 RepID=A0ABT1L6N1_9HYPH|nr:hypothetical protein [Alsobacter ponti]MCP8937051.1 hypothetical protein [Alsobacter ponti]
MLRRASLPASVLSVAIVGPALALLPAGEARAQEHRFVTPGPAPELPPCTCRANGQTFAMGETMCLRTPEGARMVRCVMVINNPSWQPVSGACPTAELPYTPRPRG